MTDTENATALDKVKIEELVKPADNKNGGNWGAECYVLDEFVIKDTPKEQNNPENKPNGDKADSESKNGNDKQNGIKEETSENQGKKKRGQNKNRPVYKIKHQPKICNIYLNAEPGTEPDCKYTNCKYVHDLKTYMETKEKDIGPVCFVYQSLGYCPRGVTCRFATQHIDQDFRNIKNKDVFTGEPQEINMLSKDVQTRLRKKTYDFKLSDTAIQLSFDIWRKNNPDKNTELDSIKVESKENGEPETKKAKIEVEEKPIGYAPEEDLIKMRPQERKKLDFRNKLYLAPLTTVGNLPFRRLCKKLGADITCGEMAMGLPLLQGHQPEWALLQRHKSEDFFGIQVCGCSPNQMGRVAQLLEENVECDFVDINMGCPIDLVFKKGMGSGLMARNRPIETISRTMANIMSRPLTIKMRTGIYKDKNIAHNLFPKLQDLGVAALTIHGRSREQRYTKLADWEYIGACKNTVDIPVFGNGDVFNYEDYILKKEQSGVDGIMIARGALIKPWIFTEIKEQRHWDISVQERLDIFKDYCNFGLEHWGSDDKGLETTRKFLLEWLSFTYRYVPFGILKNPPQKINERIPGRYRGRCEMETLLCSNNSQDWVKITEMFLGKVKDNFEFVPKHKANSYS